MELLGRTLFSKSKRVLNVGGGVKGALPPHYHDFKHLTLDIDPKVQPDYCFDARDMRKAIKANSFDAVYCSHNLEHFYAHEVPIVLEGMFHVLKSGGFVEIRVPDILAALAEMQHLNLDLEDTLYVSGMGPIATLDMIYGHRRQIATSGQPFYAHKTAFSVSSLKKKLEQAGFIINHLAQQNLEIHVIAYKP